MTTATDIANWALMVPGTRTAINDAELASNSSNEAIQINLRIDNVRRKLLRMAPWNCALKTANLVYITSAPGTPENSIAATTLWQPGQPAPPWNYEYQYPVDCLRVCWLIPATQTGFAGGVPITTAVTGGAASFWQGPPVKYKVQNDQFYPVTAAAVFFGGQGYNYGDYITLPGGIPASGSAPIGAPCVLLVSSVTNGAVTGVQIVPNVLNYQNAPSLMGVAQGRTIGGSYFNPITNPVPQVSTTGSGINATFNLTFGTPASQRVILCNQEFAIGAYVQDISDPDVMDQQFIDAWAKALGAEITIPLTGDKKLANLAVQDLNQMIQWARTGDGNEGFTVNDITPDWIRGRGFEMPTMYSGPNTGFDWGGMYPSFG